MLGEFVNVCVSPSLLLHFIREWQPRLILGKLQTPYPALSKVMLNVLRAPECTAGVEPNKKISKRVQSSPRCSLGEAKVEKQVAVVHNEFQNDREQPNKRIWV